MILSTRIVPRYAAMRLGSSDLLVVPAMAGIEAFVATVTMDSGLRRNDGKGQPIAVALPQGGYVMRGLRLVSFVATAILLAPVVTAAPKQDLALCMECTTPTQFTLTAIAAFGRSNTRPLPPTVLVVNPSTNAFGWITLRRSADGKSVEGRPGQRPSNIDRAAIAQAATEAPIFVPSCNGVVQIGPNAAKATMAAPKASGAADVAGASADGRAVERGTLVQLQGDVYGMVLCANKAFATYETHDQAALSRAIQAATLRRAVAMPGAERVIGTWKTPDPGKTKIQKMWRPGSVCAIFNNGDSACYGKPSNPGGASGMVIVNHGAHTEYGAPGSKAGSGGTWLNCGVSDQHVSGCVATANTP